MRCPKCGQPGIIIEVKGEKGDKHIKCPKCGLHEIRDREGRKLLLDTVDRGEVLLS